MDQRKRNLGVVVRLEHGLDGRADGHVLSRIADQIAEHADAAGLRQLQHRLVQRKALTAKTDPDVAAVANPQGGGDATEQRQRLRLHRDLQAAKRGHHTLTIFSGASNLGRSRLSARYRSSIDRTGSTTFTSGPSTSFVRKSRSRRCPTAINRIVMTSL